MLCIPHNLCLVIEVFNPFTFNVIVDMVILFSIWLMSFVPVSPYVFGDGGFFVVFVLLFCVCTILIPIKKQKKLKKNKNSIS